MRISPVLIAVWCTASLLAQSPTLKPGQYEVVSEISIAGRQGGLPPRKDLHCYTAQDVQDLANLVAKRDVKQNCKTLNSKVTGSTLTFTTECTNADGSRLTSSGEVNFPSPESYRAVVNMKQSSGRSANPILNGSNITITAKRIGDCTK